MWLVSFLSGGLAGGLVSTFMNRWFHWRDMRVKFYPVLNNIHSAYTIRFEKREGQFWVNIVGQDPSQEDAEFVSHRSRFIVYDLIQFNELREVRKLRKAIIANQKKEHKSPDILTKLDLEPEYVALTACLNTLHKKLKMD
jgi:hypothetical protein